MTVLDASVVAEAFATRGPLARAALGRFESEREWDTPQHFHAEVLAALRGLHSGGHLDVTAARTARQNLMTLQISTYALEPLEPRIWELRNNATVYDAWYIALAEALETSLVTTDRKFLGVSGRRCEVEVIAA